MVHGRERDCNHAIFNVFESIGHGVWRDSVCNVSGNFCWVWRGVVREVNISSSDGAQVDGGEGQMLRCPKTEYVLARTEDTVRENHDAIQQHDAREKNHAANKNLALIYVYNVILLY
mgnify:CR=1 FL=1